MGAKMKIIITILLMCVFSFAVNAQHNRIKEAKGVALCECYKYLALQYDSINTLPNTDYSIGYFIQNSELSIPIIFKIQEYTRANCMKFYSVPQKLNGNMVGFSCWSFYESKDLDLYVRKLIKEYKRK